MAPLNIIEFPVLSRENARRAIALSLALGIALGIAADNLVWSRVENYVQEARFAERGYVRCVNGAWNIGNIDFQGRNRHDAPMLNLADGCEP